MQKVPGTLPGIASFEKKHTSVYWFWGKVFLCLEPGELLLVREENTELG